MKEKSSQQFFFLLLLCVGSGEQKKFFSSFIPSNWRKRVVERAKKKLLQKWENFFHQMKYSTQKKEANRENQIKCKNGTRIVNHNVI